ncbi:MAG: gliding motility-associated C-terminal domain-containing protein [Bacteroidia bacterium]|nr:gliding motility-associated C-terminal domain-containing protein [Bacteroidia bacterium]
MWVIFLPPGRAADNSVLKDSFIAFKENKGQWNADILYRFSTSTIDLHIKKKSLDYYFMDEKTMAVIGKHAHIEHPQITTINSHYIQLNFDSANSDAVIENTLVTTCYYNYFIGKDQNKWKSKVRCYRQLIYKNLYPGIDLKIKGNDFEKGLEYDWIIKPHADINTIQMRYEGATSILLEYGDLNIIHSLGYMREKRPYAYQLINGIQFQVEVQYVVKGNKVSFTLPASYNKNYELIIDPDLIFSTYSGSLTDNFGFTATYDSSGNLYAGGIAGSEPAGTFKVTPGVFQTSYKGGAGRAPVFLACDIAFSKYSADGTQLLYGTYYGGADDEYPHSFVVDKHDNLVVMGTTYSTDFPVTLNAYDTSKNDNVGATDLIIGKFTSDGTQLIASTYFGGSQFDGRNDNAILNKFYADNFKGDVITDQNNNIIVGSMTTSTDFPYTTGSFGVAGSGSNGTQKGVVFKLSADLKSLLFCSALPGNGEDAIYSVDLNKNDDIFIAGGTTGQTLFSNMKNTYSGGESDGFMAKIKSDGSKVLNAMFFGTTAYDQVLSLELDEAENLYITGQSLGNIPVKGNVYYNPNGHQFLAGIDNNFSNTIFSTVFGSGRPFLDITINAFLVDNCGRIFISGWGGTNGVGSTYLLPVTSNAIKPSTDGHDFYLLVLGKNAGKVLFASYYGGNSSHDHVDGGTSRFDKKGFIYQSVCASCDAPVSDFPTTASAVYKTKSTERCSNAAFKIRFNFSEALFNYVIDSCSGTITFSSQTPDAIGYQWFFPNGQISTDEKPVGLIKDFKDKPVTLIISYGSVCKDTVTNIILYHDTVLETKFINVFTPDNDQINDVFIIEGLTPACDQVHIEIYNRWGQLVFESNTINFAWDGTDKKGLAVTEGIYYYLANVEQGGKPKKNLHGTITLMR